MPSPINVPLTPPRVPVLDERTGTISREWYMFFLSLRQGLGGTSVSVDDLQKGPPPVTVDETLSYIETQTADVAPSSEGLLEQVAELQKQIEALNATPQPPLGTLSAINVDWVPYIGFDTAPPWIGTTAGQFWFDSTTGAFNAKMGNNHITQQVGEEFFQYGKASAAIDDTSVQLVYKTGTVGASGVIKFAPAVAGIVDTDLIIGIATEPLALNAFGRVTTMGTVHGLNTTGSVYGEVWADNEDIWYNPVTGGLTKTKPVAPNVKLQVGTVISAGSGGSGSFYVKIGSSSILGGTDANVQFGALSNGDVVTYDSVAGYWKNASVALPASGNNPKSLSIFSPSASENVTLFYTSSSMSVSHVQAVVSGSSPSVTYSIKSGSDRSVTSTTHVSSATVTSTTTGASATIGTAIIPANSWVWLETSATSGTVTFFSINLEF